MSKGFAVRTKTAVLGQMTLIGLLRPRRRENLIERTLRTQRPAKKETATRQRDGQGNGAQTTEHLEATLH